RGPVVAGLQGGGAAGTGGERAEAVERGLGGRHAVQRGADEHAEAAGQSAGPEGALYAGSGQCRGALGGTLRLDTGGASAIGRDVSGARRPGEPESTVVRCARPLGP